MSTYRRSVDPALAAVLLEVHMQAAQRTVERPWELAHQRLARVTSVLAALASSLALWDLSLLARLGR